MPELQLALNASSHPLGATSVLVTDGRVAFQHDGISIAHVVPEAMDGGGLAAGVLVEPLSVEAWRDALEAALSWDAPRREQLVAAGAQRLEQLLPARVALQWQQLYRQLR